MEKKNIIKNMITSKLIAPCGMNCAACVAYLRDKNKCPGCREYSGQKEEYRTKCIIKTCQIIKKNNWKYCTVKCKSFPCQRLKNLDKRYRTKYGMSMIENLEFIKEKGIRAFIKKEKKKRQKGDKIICIHNKKLYEQSKK